jgi:methylase of polypeptide subunit release factors
VNTLGSAGENPVSRATAVVGLAHDLAAAGGGVGFRVGPLAELLGPVAHAALGRDEVLPAERVTHDRPTEPLAVLARLWLLGRPVARVALDQALPEAGTAGAEVLGLVEASGAAPDDEVRPLLELTPYAADGDEWWLASDLTHPRELVRPLRPDHVLGVGGASTTLARWTPRNPVTRALDIGTGCGVQAFHLATHAAEVTATDTSARCLRIARLNAQLNAAAPGGPFAGRTLDLRQGSLLHPVGGRQFDLVVSNPPFVITPRTGGRAAYTYRDGGLSGDDVVRRLVEEVGSVLAPGGTAQLLGNWEHVRGESWVDRVGGWLGASGLHGWVVQREVQDPAEYAETWARDGGQAAGSAAYTSMYAAWLDDFAMRGVEAVGFGVITLRRPVDPAVPQRIRRLEENPGPVAESLGSTVAAVLAAEEWLLGTSDEDLMAARLRVAADVTEERFGAPGADDPSVIRLRQGGGLQRSVRADTALAAVVGACDGDLPLGVLVETVAGLLGEDASGVRQRVVPAVRRLVADGLLTLA